MVQDVVEKGIFMANTSHDELCECGHSQKLCVPSHWNIPSPAELLHPQKYPNLLQLSNFGLCLGTSGKI